MSEESSVLIIRHLPSTLPKEEKENLLRHFGASHVRCMPDTGRMRHTAFAIFPSHADAKCSLSRLHQLEVLGCRLVAEFAKPQQAKHFPHETDFKKKDMESKKSEKVKQTEKEEIQENMEELYKKLHAIAPKFGLDYLSSPLLKYKYPPPTQSIITNIVHALAAVPNFYTQVLHLMNKMNLPAPFGPVTSAPPLHSDILFGDKFSHLDQMVSEEESEIETDQEDEGDYRRKDPRTVARRRLAVSALKRPRKKQRLQQLIAPIIPAMREVNRSAAMPSDVFEVPETEIGTKKILFNIKPNEDGEDNIEKRIHVMEEEKLVTEPPIQVAEGGFGVIEPQKSSSDLTSKETQDAETMLRTMEFVTLSDIRRNRLSSREMKSASVFKNYESGETTYRLYVKNLAKQVEEKDLVRIYGRYVDRDSENDRNMFDIRLMKEGRMKGQAFVTLANEKQAEQALRDTNGYLLLGKPIVVQFARSARPKENKK